MDRLSPDIPVALDEEWFKKLLRISVRYDKLLSPDPVSDLQKNDWLQQTEGNHPFTYSALTKANFARVHTRLIDLRELVEVNETGIAPAVTQLWLAKLVDLTSRVSCLEEIQTVLYQDAVAISEMPSLQKKLDEIFGVPTTDLFTLTLAELTDRLAKKGRLEVFREQHPTLCTSVDTYVTSVKSYPRAQFATPDTSDTLPPQSVQELKNLMDSELERIGVSGLWSVKIDTTGKYHRVLVFYKKKVIILPVTESFLKNKIAYSVTGRKAARLLVHEISTHVIRSTNGYFSKLKLLSVGLDRYTSGEEGVATFREQRAFGSSTYFAGFESYLAIGLAYGMDRLGLERTPHELYRLLLEINRALHGQSSLLVQYRAWKRVLRTYIFLPHNTFLINPKDVVYRAGNVQIQALYQQGKFDDEKINIGMYDPCNESHVTALTELGLL